MHAGRLILTLLGLITAATSPCHAAVHDPDRTLIIFGGIGHLEDGAQPEFARIIRGNAPDDQAAFRQLNIAINQQVAALAGRGAFGGRLSGHGLILRNDDAMAALTEVNGRPATVRDLDALPETFPDRFILMLAASLETEEVMVRKAGPVTLRVHVPIVGMSAILIKAGTGEILLAETVLREDQIDEDRLTGTATARFLQLYVEAAERALERIAARMRTADVATILDPWDRYMVIGAKTGEDAVRLFNAGPSPDRAAICGVPAVCRTGDHTCSAMVAVLSHGMSEALSQSGRLTVPALGWGSWTRSGEFRVGIQLRVPKGNSLVRDRQALRVSADAARYKVVASLDALWRQTQATRTPVIVEDHYLARVGATALETDPLDCTRGHRSSTLLVAGNEREAARVTHLRKARAPAATGGLERTLYLIAIYNALTEGRDALR